MLVYRRALLLPALVLVGVRFRQEETRREIEGLRRLIYSR